ncbi:hypothetical protein Sango_0276100 [Sesamum angolense]|uniref:Uncharacterized protein n=1 Tax=Sesamum angolense TaxID=2727404 RepID=A0AAE1X8E7_9LAMI|nr:hypothetical protein Sango_0276100 [Sesamum angolense]
MALPSCGRCVEICYPMVVKVLFIVTWDNFGRKKFAEASIWKLAEQDVSSILFHGGGLLCNCSRAFGYLHPWKTSGAAEKYQLGFLVAAFSFNLSNLIIFTPMTIELVLTSPPFPLSMFCGQGAHRLAIEIGFTRRKSSVDDKPMKMSHGGGKEYLLLVAGLEKSLTSLNASVGQPMLTKASNSNALSTSFRLSINNAEKRPTN